MNVRAKFLVEKVEKTEWAETVTFRAVASGTPEDNSYSAATPSGSMSMAVTNKAVWGQFLPGQKYYLDFSVASA